MTPVVLVHGLWMPGLELAALRGRLARAGFAPVTFRYASVADDLDASAARLAKHLATMAGDTIHLLGHSLGGLVILKHAERHGVERIGRIVCLGSPFNGSLAGKRLARLPGGARLLGRAIAQAERESTNRHWDGRRELGIIAGSLGVGLGRALGSLPMPHDGTIAVAETRLAGASHHIVLPVTHFSMLCSRRVAAQAIAFLRDGRFASAAS